MTTFASLKNILCINVNNNWVSYLSGKCIIHFLRKTQVMFLSNLVSVFLNLYQICNDHKKVQGFEISFLVPQNTYRNGCLGAIVIKMITSLYSLYELWWNSLILINYLCSFNKSIRYKYFLKFLRLEIPYNIFLWAWPCLNINRHIHSTSHSHMQIYALTHIFISYIFVFTIQFFSLNSPTHLCTAWCHVTPMIREGTY